MMTGLEKAFEKWSDGAAKRPPGFQIQTTQDFVLQTELNEEIFQENGKPSKVIHNWSQDD